MSIVSRDYDLYIQNPSGTKYGFLLARQGLMDPRNLPVDHRAWQRTNEPKSDFSQDPGNVQTGKGAGETIVNFDNIHRLGFSGMNQTVTSPGWGEGYQRVPGRYAYTRNVDLRFPGQATLSPMVSSTAIHTSTLPATNFFELPGDSSHLYVARGEYIDKISVDSPGTISNVYDAGATGAVSQVAVINGQAIIASYATDTGLASTTKYGSDFSSLSSAGYSLDCAAAASNAAGPGATIYGSYRASGISKITYASATATFSDGTQWAGNAIPIGDTGEIMRWAVQYGEYTYYCSPIGVYAFNQDYVSINILPEMRNFRNSRNGIGSWVWHGALWIPTVRGLYCYDGSIQNIGPTAQTTVRTDDSGRYFGYPTAGCGDLHWNYVATWNGTDTYVFAGREGGAYEPRMVWHTLWYLQGGPITAMAITGLTDPPRLFMIQNGSPSTLLYVDLARSENPLQDPQNTQASGSIYWSFNDGGLPTVSKAFTEEKLTADSLTATETISVSYRYPDTPGSSWTSVGSAATSSPKTWQPASPLVGTGVAFKVDLARGSGTATPIFRSLQVRALAQLDGADHLKLSILLQDDQRNLDGAVRFEDMNTLETFLKGLEGQTSYITIWTPDDDPTGSGQQFLMPSDSNWQVTEVALDTKPGTPEKIYTGVFRKVP